MFEELSVQQGVNKGNDDRQRVPPLGDNVSQIQLKGTPTACFAIPIGADNTLACDMVVTGFGAFIDIAVGDPLIIFTAMGAGLVG